LRRGSIHFERIKGGDKTAGKLFKATVVDGEVLTDFHFFSLIPIKTDFIFYKEGVENERA